MRQVLVFAHPWLLIYFSCLSYMGSFVQQLHRSALGTPDPWHHFSCLLCSTKSSQMISISLSPLSLLFCIVCNLTSSCRIMWKDTLHACIPFIIRWVTLIFRKHQVKEEWKQMLWEESMGSKGKKAALSVAAFYKSKFSFIGIIRYSPWCIKSWLFTPKIFKKLTNCTILWLNPNTCNQVFILVTSLQIAYVTNNISQASVLQLQCSKESKQDYRTPGWDYGCRITRVL